MARARPQGDCAPNPRGCPREPRRASHTRREPPPAFGRRIPYVFRPGRGAHRHRHRRCAGIRGGEHGVWQVTGTPNGQDDRRGHPPQQHQALLVQISASGLIFVLMRVQEALRHFGAFFVRVVDHQSAVRDPIFRQEHSDAQMQQHLEELTRALQSRRALGRSDAATPPTESGSCETSRRMPPTSSCPGWHVHTWPNSFNSSAHCSAHNRRWVNSDRLDLAEYNIRS
jgi:hypothetical protein